MLNLCYNHTFTILTRIFVKTHDFPKPTKKMMASTKNYRCQFIVYLHQSLIKIEYTIINSNNNKQ